MSGYCYLGRRRGRRRGRSLRKRLFILLVFLLLAALLVHLRLSPLMMALAEAEGIRRSEALITATVARRMQENATAYDEIVAIAYKSDGSVSSLRVDAPHLLGIRSELVGAILSEMQEEEYITAEIPVSSLIGLNFLPSTPNVAFELRCTRSINAYFVSRFQEQGINQTHHSIRLYLSFDILLLIPGGQKVITVTRELPIAETVIVGDVPDSYTEIHRLTDDITETEIDDIYDFGAEAN